MRHILVAICCSVVSVELLSKSLEDHIRGTLTYNPQLKKSEAELRAVEERINQAIAEIRPKIGLSMSRSKVAQDRKDQGLPLRRQNYVTESDSLLLQQPIYRPILYKKLQLSKVEKEAEEFNFKQKKRELLMRVIELYTSYIRSLNLLKITEKKLDLLEKQMQASKKMYDSGRGTVTEIAEVRASLDKGTVELISAKQDIRSTLSELSFVSGIKNQSTAQRKTKFDNLLIFEEKKLQDWERQSLISNFRLRQLQNKIKVASIVLESEKYNRYPTLDLNIQLSKGSSESTFFINSETENKSIGLSFYLPIYARGGTSSRIRQAVHFLESEKENFRFEQDELKNRIQKAYFGLNESLKLSKALQTAIESAKIELLANEKSSLAGVRRTLDVLISQQKLISVEKDFNNTVMDSVIYWANLKMLSGTLQEESIRKISNFLN